VHGICGRLQDNTGARRLNTILERVLADVSFNAAELAEAAAANGEVPLQYEVTEEYVMKQLQDLLKKQDLSKYVL
jgi:ATP-dependent HslUV protease ATP-binding subunit HslU